MINLHFFLTDTAHTKVSSNKLYHWMSSLFVSLDFVLHVVGSFYLYSSEISLVYGTL